MGPIACLGKPKKKIARSFRFHKPREHDCPGCSGSHPLAWCGLRGWNPAVEPPPTPDSQGQETQSASSEWCLGGRERERWKWERAKCFKSTRAAGVDGGRYPKQFMLAPPLYILGATGTASTSSRAATPPSSLFFVNAWQRLRRWPRLRPPLSGSRPRAAARRRASPGGGCSARRCRG